MRELAFSTSFFPTRWRLPLIRKVNKIRYLPRSAIIVGARLHGEMQFLKAHFDNRVQEFQLSYSNFIQLFFVFATATPFAATSDRSTQNARNAFTILCSYKLQLKLTPIILARYAGLFLFWTHLQIFLTSDS